MSLYREAIRIGKGVAIRLGIGDQILSPLEEMRFPQSPTNRHLISVIKLFFEIEHSVWVISQFVLYGTKTLHCVYRPLL